MTKVVRDILFDVDRRDLVFSSKASRYLNYYEIIWGSLFVDDTPDILYANVEIPSYGVDSMVVDSDGKYRIHVRSSYRPQAVPFVVRLVTKVNGEYVKIEQNHHQNMVPVESLAYFPHRQVRVNASELLFIDNGGKFVVELVVGSPNVAYLYSSCNMDFDIGFSDDQSAQLLSICGPGKYYKHPLSGVDITRYINTVVEYTDFMGRISDEFEKNKTDVQEVDFDSSTGKIQVKFKNEDGIVESAKLVPVEDLDYQNLDVLDSELDEIGDVIDVDGLDVDYEDVEYDMDISNLRLKSCFANGVWISSYPWTGGELWKSHE